MHYLRQPVNLGQDVDSIDVDQTCMRSRDGCLATVSMRPADVPGMSVSIAGRAQRLQPRDREGEENDSTLDDGRTMAFGFAVTKQSIMIGGRNPKG